MNRWRVQETRQSTGEFKGLLLPAPPPTLVRLTPEHAGSEPRRSQHLDAHRLLLVLDRVLCKDIASPTLETGILIVL